MLREFKTIRPTNLARTLELFPILSDFFQIFSDEIKISSEIIREMSFEIEEQRVVSRKTARRFFANKLRFPENVQKV